MRLLVQSKVLLGLIFILAFITRSFQNEMVPVSLNRDEVGLGYDSLSLLRTGRDQYGKLLPLTLRSSDDYKPALYAYTAILPLVIFGPNQMAIRLPSVILGSLTVLTIYLLTNNLLQHYSFIANGNKKKMALLSAFVLTVSPWHMQYSRGAYEVTLATFILVTGVSYLLQKNFLAISSLLSAVYFGFGVLAYHSTRFMVPVLSLPFFFLIRSYMNKKKLALFGVVLAIFFCISLPSLLSPKAQIRFRVLNIFITENPQNEQYRDESAREVLDDLERDSGISGMVVHNRRIATFRYQTMLQFLNNIYLHLSPKFLLVGYHENFREKNHAPSYGLMHLWEAIFLVIGFYVFCRSFVNRYSSILLLWFISGLVLAAMSWDSPNSWRSLSLVPVFAVWTAWGLQTARNILQKEAQFILRTFEMFFLATVFFSLVIYYHQYFVHLNIETSQEWRYGRREAALYADSLKNQYKKIVVSTELDDPHLYFLYYLRYDPVKYLAEGGTVSGGWTAKQNHFGPFEFRSFDYLTIKHEPGLLLIGLPREFPSGTEPFKIIKYVNGQDAIWMVKT